MQRLVLQNSGSLLIVFLSTATGVTLTVLAGKLGYDSLIMGMLAVLLAVTVLLSVPVVWSMVARLNRELSWWHLLWALFFVSGLTFRIRTTEFITENPLDPAALFRIGFVGLVGFVLFGVWAVGRRLTLRRIFRGFPGLMAFYAFVGIASTLWSVYPSWTLYKSVEYFVGVLLIGIIVSSVKTEVEFKSLFDWMWLLTGLLALSVWGGVLLWPEEAMSRGVGVWGIQIRGIFPRMAANSVGDLGALLGIVAMARLLFAKGASRRFYFIVFLMALVTLALSQSRSPLTGFLLSIPVVLFAAGKIGGGTALTLFIPLIASFSPLGDYFWRFFMRGQSEELFLSLSGRVYYWRASLPFIQKSPFIGHGAYAAGRFLVAPRFASTLSSLHGTWPEVLIGTGILGFLPLFLAIVGTWVVLLRKRNWGSNILVEQMRLEAIGVMTLLSVRSFFSVSFIWHPALTWLLALGYAEFLRQHYARASRP